MMFLKKKIVVFAYARVPHSEMSTLGRTCAHICDGSGQLALLLAIDNPYITNADDEDLDDLRQRIQTSGGRNEDSSLHAAHGFERSRTEY